MVKLLALSERIVSASVLVSNVALQVRGLNVCRAVTRKCVYFQSGVCELLQRDVYLFKWNGQEVSGIYTFIFELYLIAVYCCSSSSYALYSLASTLR
jgi:hypothetical protein